jgi:pimeloyl-ACP methyl ester carboxylesterase
MIIPILQTQYSTCAVTSHGCFKSKNNDLTFIAQLPFYKTVDTGVIFVHAADGNRLGPHRMFVEFAEHFLKLDLATFRFDLTGCGDSSGTPTDNIEKNIDDLLSAIKFFKIKYDLKNIILFGISRGAKICFSALQKYNIPITAAILLSMPASNSTTAAKSLAFRLKEYRYKFTDPAYFKKLITGKVNPVNILKTLNTAIKIKNRYSQSDIENFATTCPVLLIYGQNDPIAKKSSEYYHNLCIENKIKFNLHLIPNANHSFFHYKWKEQILNIIERWLKNLQARDNE